MRRVLEGDTEAFSIVVDRYGDGVLRLAMRIVGDHDLARDIVQETFIKAWSHLGRWRGKSTLSTWLFRIAYNTAITHMRRRRRPLVSLHSSVADEEEPFSSEEENVLSEERYAELEAALGRLAPDERALVTLFYNDDCSVAECARIMRLSESNIKVRLHRVRKKLKDEL